MIMKVLWSAACAACLYGACTANAGWLWTLLLLWTAATCGYTAVLLYCGVADYAECLAKHEVYGGRTARARAVLAPALVLYAAFAQVLASLSRVSGENNCAQVYDRVFVGRVPFDHSDLPWNTTLVIDLTTEFEPSLSVLAACAYRCCPCLDDSFPAWASLRFALSAARAEHQRGGTLYIHCALGHSRSAGFAALLLAVALPNEFPLWQDAFNRVRAARPRAHLNVHQRRCIQVAYDALTAQSFELPPVSTQPPAWTTQ